ncbi:Hydantoinase/oxoprolinase [Pholiota molesta]|nr:Hydantoinase/oxoprolinase [Pholiota molesta]
MVLSSGTAHKYRIGVDVGGTNTDSVIIDITQRDDPTTRGVIASFKHATTPNVTTGIEGAVREVLQASGIDPGCEDILGLTIGTTHFINAVVQLDSTRLAKVAVIRLAAPYTTECPSFIDFPKDLKELLEGHTAIIHGGLQIDGRTINDIQESELLNQARIIEKKGLKNIALVGIYSPLDVDGKQEYRARDILKEALGDDVNIVCSCDVGHVGFLERENASILNASITAFAQRTIRGYRRALRRLGIKCGLYLTQNDGTLTTAEEAARLPIKTFASGATNSMRGASYLAGVDLVSRETNRFSTDDSEGKRSGKSMIVVDVGGTTTDVGVLLPSGYPRQAAAFIEVAGVRTNFSMPDVQSIGLGGGSRVRKLDGGRISVGPDSVGHYLTRDSLVFGGTQLTATDVSVRASGLALDEEVVKKAHINVKRLLENAIDRMKTSPEDCDVLLVGGGSIIAPSALKGVKKLCIIPKHHEVANAVGAAIASVSGEVDTIEILQGRSLAEAVEQIKQRAIDEAIRTGAVRGSVGVVDVNILPVQYVTNQATRIIVRAVGELGQDGSITSKTFWMWIDDEAEADPVIRVPAPKELIDYVNYKPKIEGKEWVLSETDLFFIMEGCGILGTGGGGSPYPAYLICRQILRDGGSIRIIDHTALPDDAVLARGGFMGSPSVGSERIRSGAHLRMAGLELAKYCGVTEFGATLCDEIGGSNGMQSLQMTKYYGVPALDGDLMGRAYPMLNQVLPVIMRVVTTEMGSSAALDYGVTRSQSQAWRMGRAVAICRQMKFVSLSSFYFCELAKHQFSVHSDLKGVRIARLRADELEDVDEGADDISSDDEDGATMLIPFQNENLCAYVESTNPDMTINRKACSEENVHERASSSDTGAAHANDAKQREMKEAKRMLGIEI